jgi:hypothetical protein
MKTRALVSIFALAVVAYAPAALAQEKRIAARDASLDPAGVTFTDGRPDSVEPGPPPPAKGEPHAGLLSMRSPGPGTGAKIDTTIAPYTTKDGNPAVAGVFFVSGQYKITDGFGMGLRLGFDRVGASGSDAKLGFLNPQVSGVYGWKLGRHLRLATGLSVTVPVGSGGGNSGDPDIVSAHKAAAQARSAMEGSAFSVNDLGTGYSVDLAYLGYGLTAQLGTQVTTSFRVRGETVQPDAFKANWTSALGLGYFLIPQLALCTELRYQHYISTPASVEKDPSTRINLTAAGGLRTHLQVSKSVSIKPGASYGHGIVGPVAKNGYHMVQIDVPVSF